VALKNLKQLNALRIKVGCLHPVACIILGSGVSV
jgi:hypothetical protein